MPSRNKLHFRLNIIHCVHKPTARRHPTYGIRQQSLYKIINEGVHMYMKGNKYVDEPCFITVYM